MKLALLVIPSEVGFTKGNIFIPSTLKRNKTKNNNPPILINAGIIVTKVVNIILKLFALFTSLRTLAILKVLKIEVAVPMFVNTSDFIFKIKLILYVKIYFTYSKITLIIVTTTIKKSNLFQEFFK